MTAAVVLIRRCMIILAILLCYFQVRSQEVDCERYPFHHSCRGIMARKRGMFPVSYAPRCEESKGHIDCIKEYEERQRTPYIPLSKSKLLIALLDGDLQRDIARSARHKLRNDESDEQKSTLMETFLSKLESSDSY